MLGREKSQADVKGPSSSLERACLHSKASGLTQLEVPNSPTSLPCLRLPVALLILDYLVAVASGFRKLRLTYSEVITDLSPFQPDEVGALPLEQAASPQRSPSASA